MKKLTGRESEISNLNYYINTDGSEFIAVYGRRRVGKTFLIRSFFKNKFTFDVTGLANSNYKEQLASFHYSLKKVSKSFKENIATDWLTAFFQLTRVLEKSKKKKKILFIDELPWFDTPKSGFMQALEFFWNSWASARDDIVLIVCGSATSWMINKLINNKGGLYNRVTRRLKIEPFTLAECERYINKSNSSLDRYQIVQLYMVMGGIPFYWDQIDTRLSAMQNINNICFSKDGLLRGEYLKLFRSLFKKHERHEKIVNALSKKSKGLTRYEIIKLTGLPNAGSTTKLLNDLEESGFIRKYTPFGKVSRNSLYQLIDFYTNFYHKFMKNKTLINDAEWMNMTDSPKLRAWSGYAFEQICLSHIPQIKHAMGISGVSTEVSSWRSESESKIQIDLVMDRRDHIINLFEMKFSLHPFSINKSYYNNLRNKIGQFTAENNINKSVVLTMVTTYGLIENQYSTSGVYSDITMNKLFLDLKL